MLVVNIYGAPGSGKSVAAAWIFTKLKMLDVKCELVTEFAKDMVWDNNSKALHNQAYIFGNQYYKLSKLEDEVDVAITDSPLALSVIYNSDKRLKKSSFFNSMVLDVSQSFDTLDYLLPPFADKYEDIGRVHSNEESKKLHKQIEDWLFVICHNNYKELEHSEESYMDVVNDVMKKLDKRRPI